MEAINNFKAIRAKYMNVSQELYAESIKVVKELLQLMPLKTVTLEGEEQAWAITYDGGRHPEYAANPYSIVDAVYLDCDGKVWIDTDDADRIDPDTLDAGDMMTIADIVVHCYERDGGSYVVYRPEVYSDDGTNIEYIQPAGLPKSHVFLFEEAAEDWMRDAGYENFVVHKCVYDADEDVVVLK